MSSAPANVIEVKAKNAFLSAAELIVHRHAEVESTRIGLKRTNNEGSAAEQEELETAYANLYQQLSCRRIERYGGRAAAVWHPDQQVAEVVRKDGKFESFGFSAQGKLYLEYYEALFLLELNRLQLEYCEMIVSVEQAYALVLGESSSEKYNNYLVYSALSRAGYIVVKHRDLPQHSQRPFQLVAEESVIETIVTNEACIWAILDETLGNRRVPEHIRASTYYGITLSRMSDVKQQIISQTNSVADDGMMNFEFDTRKRRAQPEPDVEAAKKRICPIANSSRTSKSLVDDLKDEASYSRFKDMFQKLEMVQLAGADYDVSLDPALRSFEISFDLHLHNEGFRLSAPKTPYFSTIILPPDEPFPTHNEMVKCQQQLPYTAPLLVVSVSESKQIQAFLYYIS